MTDTPNTEAPLDIRHAVITGATGMIGSTLARLLLEEGADVTCLVRPNSPRAANLPKGIRTVEIDVNDLASVDPAAIGSADAFFHLAWMGSAPSGRGLLDAQVDNITNTLRAVDLAEALGCKVFVGAGSQAEYGRVEGALSPDTPTNPETGYGIAKLAAGRLSRLACKDKGIRHEWARILSIFGPGDAAHTMVMSVIADACAGRAPRCTKGEQLWDYLYVDDCAAALIGMAKQGSDGAVYPIGSGKQRQLREFIECICDACGTGVRPDFGAVPYYPLQVMNLRADISALEADTGFKPRVSFEEGVARTVEWYRKRLEGEAQ